MAEKQERRQLRFGCLAEVLVEAERLAEVEVRTTGSHPFPNILKHLALTHDMATGKIGPPPFPWYLKAMMFVMKPMMLRNKPLSPGIKLPPKAEHYFWPQETFSVAEALEHLKSSIKNFDENGPLDRHPVFGKVTREQNEQINCRHCALHLSFVHPIESD